MSRAGVPVADKAILVTGAARGIGAETARRLAARGARVALAGLEPDELERVAADCPGSVVLACDVTDRDAIETAVASAVAALGGLDAVVANAGIAPMGFVRSMDAVAFERTIEVNLLGVYRTVAAALPHVIERRGYVLCIASMAAVSHMPGMAAYAAAKSGVEAFADALRLEVAHLGVGVGVAYYSFIDTDLVRAADRHELASGLRAKARWPISKTYPVSEAAEAAVRGIERRSRWVCCPRWLPVTILARGVLQLTSEKTALMAIPEADALAQRLGPEVTGQIGPGGAADREAAAAASARR
jgi:NAD(P)-dependent dehydrogenase (short-subunit alcohol dehydrogenase family)